MNYNQKLSIVVPCFNEEESIPLFYEKTNGVLKLLKGLDYEFLFIDDGSYDTTLSVIKKMAQNDPQVKYLSFSRNFGKEAGIYAGLQNAGGSHVVIMDVDLQDDPSLLPIMWKAVTEENYDCAAARRVSRKGEPPIRSFFARKFYKLMLKFSSTEVVDGARDYQLMSRNVVDAILSLKEYNRFSKGIFGWVGFKKKWLEYENIERVAGETKWSFWGLFRYALEGIVAFSTAPLVFSSIIGLAFCLIAFIMVLVIIVRTLVFGDPTAGWPSLVCIIMFVSGIQLFGIGILGQYLAKTYLETKNRPIYITKEKNTGV